MKNLFTLALAACMLSACGGSEPKEFAGTIVDATMNTVTAKALTSDQTVTFSTEEADMSEANGLLLGNLVNVVYKGDLKQITQAEKVATDATYARAVGRWTEPNPIAPEEVQGVEIEIEGKASSIHMETLRYTGWELSGEAGKILLHGQSIGNDQTIDFTCEATILETQGRLMLELKDGPRYTKAE